MEELEFERLILELENREDCKSYIMKIGELPVILTAPHTMSQKKEDGTYKLNEPFTKAIVMYVAEQLNCSYIVKIKDTGVDSNSDTIETIKKNLIKIIDEQKIKLLLDIHGASEEREFDVELGNLNNLSSDFSTIRELQEAFTENGIKNVEINNPFKGGGITQFIYGKTDIDVIQIEINKKYRDIENIENIKKICDSIIYFIKQYTEIINK